MSERFAVIGKNCKDFLFFPGSPDGRGSCFKGSSSDLPHSSPSEVLAGPSSLLPAQEILLFLKGKSKPYAYIKDPVTLDLSVCMLTVPKREKIVCWAD